MSTSADLPLALRLSLLSSPTQLGNRVLYRTVVRPISLLFHRTTQDRLLSPENRSMARSSTPRAMRRKIHACRSSKPILLIWLALSVGGAAFSGWVRGGQRARKINEILDVILAHWVRFAKSAVRETSPTFTKERRLDNENRLKASRTSICVATQ